MLIDAHMHVPVRKFVPQRAYPESVTRWLARPEGQPAPAAHEIAPDFWEGIVDDPEGKKWAKDMKYLGIDISIYHTIDWGGAPRWLEEPPTLIEEMNRHNCLLAQKYPGKLYALLGLNPNRYNALEIIETGIKEWGAKGLKLFPPSGFYPNDPVCYRIYEKLAELDVPVAIHTGYGDFFPAKYCHPSLLDEPAYDFPELNFIMAHSGGGIGNLWEEALTVARSHQNIYLELAEVAPTVIKGGRLGNKGKYKDHIPMFIDTLDIMRNLLNGGCQQIIFGTDYPFMPMETIKQWVDLFKNLPAVAAQYDYDFSQEEADLICYKNAAGIMKIDIGEV